jgi:hypothetical protein
MRTSIDSQAPLRDAPSSTRRTDRFERDMVKEPAEIVAIAGTRRSWP